jgi:hypothetical protein
MTTSDLDALAALTRDYAAFQARKSGLATALAGLTVLISFCVAVYPNLFGLDLLQRPALEGFLVLPFLWLALKTFLVRQLYRGLGIVEAAPDPAYQRRLAFWLLGLALLLLACLAAALYGFVSGFFTAAKPALHPLPPGHPFDHPWAFLIWVPMLYLAPVPWAIRGVEEARAYLVLVSQCLLWLIPLFFFSFGALPSPLPLPKAAYVLGPLAFLTLLGGILAWGALALIRGWKEHREYLAILRSLPRVQEG